MGFKVFGIDLSPRMILDPVGKLTQTAAKSLGLIPDVPSVPSMPAPPDAAAAAAAAEKARMDRKKRYGRQSTILTSPLGTTEDATVQRKSLLGA